MSAAADHREPESSQRTLRSAIGCVGIGIHTGARATLTMRPAAEGRGIVFVREDLPGTAPIPARAAFVADTTRCTQLQGPDGVTVNTVEHVLAALAAWGVDNVEIALDGPEVPALDGSAEPFVFLVGCAGVELQDAVRPVLEVLKPVRVEHGGRSAALLPNDDDGLHVDMTIDFDHPIVGRQALALDVDLASFRRELARARTFGFAEDVDSLRARGLARGGSLDNAIVVSRHGVLNPSGLRWPDEFVRHKALDAVGDLYLAGSLKARFEGRGSGHMLHARVVRELLADPSAWRIVDDGDAVEPAMDAPFAAQLGAD
ncbi:MAG: UDP-3-O-acyl-N-acetylglucosamine deacetylase [Pseudomonadota bacterium]